MAFYPDVKPGDTFTPNAFLANDVRHFFNQLNGFRDDQVSGNHNVVIVQVYNESESETLKPGMPVNFGTKPMVNNAIPCVPYTKDDESWGVIPQPIQPLSIGDCIVSGPVQVTISGSKGKYAIPTNEGFKRQESANGNAAQLLYATGSTGVICLGAGGGGSRKSNDVKLATIDGDYTNCYPATYLDDNGNTVKTFIRCTSLGLGESFALPKSATVVAFPIETEAIAMEII
jgi:hypothetical protein